MSTNQTQTFPWMTTDFFKSVLNDYEGSDNFQLHEFNVTTGTNKGENFASAVFRVKLNYLLQGKPKETSVIVKTSSESSAVSEMLSEMGTFESEAQIYSKILVECGKLLPNFKIAPKLLHVDKELKAMVLEDLNLNDFKLADRRTRLNLSKAKIVIEKLAMFHAATAAMHFKEADIMELHQTSAIEGDDTPLSFFFAVSFQETLLTIQNTEELKEYLPMLDNFDIIERERNVFKRGTDDVFHVLNHGDLWINNIFFSYDKKLEPIDSMLVDFQECFWGSPGIDLNHFLYTSCDRDVHNDHVDHLIQLYHEYLTKTLKTFCFPKFPSLEDIRQEVQKKKDQGLIALFSVVPVLMIENPEHANPENFVSDGEGAATIRREVYGNPKFVEVLKYLLPKLIDKKVL